MSKFNAKVERNTTKTVNHAGGVAYTLDAKLELYSAVVTASLSDKFYETEGEALIRMKKLIEGIAKIDPLFIAKLAVYAREKMYLRSVPGVLAVELARTHSGDDIVSRAVARTVARVDEITELLAYYAKANGRNDVKKLGKLSKQIQKGLAKAFNKFDEYAFAKYDRDGAIKLRDALFLVHPKAKDANQQALFDKIVSGTLATPDTWEVELSKGGDKKTSWEKMIESKKLGYMATLRNLRNIIEAGVSIDHLTIVALFLADPAQVWKSKQFPFRFLAAYREIQPLASGNASMLLDALESAMIASAQNIKGFGYEQSIAVSVDTSGSMSSFVSDKSKMSYQDVGLVLGMLLHNRCKNVETSIFGTTHKIINLPKNNILSNAGTLTQYSDMVGSSTNGHLVIEDLIKRKEVKDKVMIFTDCQLWDSNQGEFWGGPTRQFNKIWQKYREIAPNAKLYLFDVAGYGTTPVSVHAGGVYLIGGWSDKVFDMLEAYESGSSAVAEIEKIVL